MSRRGAGKQRPNRMNRLPIAPNDSADIALPQLHLKDCRFAARNLREHHLVGKFNQLANNELQKLLHEGLRLSSDHTLSNYRPYNSTCHPDPAAAGEGSLAR